ncbi:hypothetical protein FQN53_006241 [Emmonsiellopsis sp. PD_33]|nr:hypothetical protein FQN53_006241 [Emmonsiellopsis sp. PD_33]
MADYTEYAGPSKEWLDLEATLPQDNDNLTVEQMRDAANKGRDAAAAEDMIKEGLQSQVVIAKFSIPTRDGSSIEGRSFRPVSIPTTRPLPVYVHSHGGGFLFGTPDSEDAICSRTVVSLAAAGEPAVVVNVNYRHTPDNPNLTAWNDLEDAFHWLHENMAFIGGESDKVVIGGISAGAWITAALVLSQNIGKDKQLAARPRIRGQVLMIPCVVHGEFRDASVSSYVQCENAPILSIKQTMFFTGLLDVKDPSPEDRRLSPGLATPQEAKGLPPSTFGVAGNDPLRDEGLLFAKMLSEAGVPTKVDVFRGLPHGFRRYGPEKIPLCNRWDEVVVEGIQYALSNPVAGGFEIRAD